MQQTHFRYNDWHFLYKFKIFELFLLYYNFVNWFKVLICIDFRGISDQDLSKMPGSRSLYLSATDNTAEDDLFQGPYSAYVLLEILVSVYFILPKQLKFSLIFNIISILLIMIGGNHIENNFGQSSFPSVKIFFILLFILFLVNNFNWLIYWSKIKVVFRIWIIRSDPDWI